MKKYVLVVDDSNEVREIISFVLEQIGLDVVTVGSGEEMPPMLTPRVPDLILLDVMMPGEDGFQLCRSLREQASTASVPIIIMTAHNEGIYQRISRDVGASQHITKPFHPTDLAEKVKALLYVEKVEN